MIPPTSTSEVPADHQGLGRAIPRFLRTKCAIKCVLCLLFSSPGDVALCAGRPRAARGAVPVPPARPPPVLRSWTRARATGAASQRAGAWRVSSFLVKSSCVDHRPSGPQFPLPNVYSSIDPGGGGSNCGLISCPRPSCCPSHSHLRFKARLSRFKLGTTTPATDIHFRSCSSGLRALILWALIAP